MRAINHALTGAFIGLTVAEPAAALPAALVSHYALDIIPHHGIQKATKKWLVSNAFVRLLYLDVLLCALLVLVLALTHPSNWQLAVVCAFAAAVPDFASIPRFSKALARQDWQPGLYSKFASGIQWFERPIGAVVEAVWFVAAIILLRPFL